ncbi:SAM-dependent methyltransferase [Streptomyces sp. BG9H]|uniref:SAM-dependent methyltransferase n=1 Tax=Streptomyces anatolicus TaxID=2675858 RepID=A0ABS6YGJ1_9ACTN|nr:SAM-dependent methyltransferase [Streptomyces anatolicus]MBW5420526.1 SAM-dependent methyltransferase [Streptomyces anatolicus]
MTPTLVQSHLPRAGSAPRVDLGARARDWAEIQERMLVPLYEAVYERLDVGGGTRLLGLGCGSGLALLMAASRGAAVTGVDASAPERLALARERLSPEAASQARARTDARLVEGGPADAAGPGVPAYNLVTAFQPIGCMAGDSEGLTGLLEAAAPLAGHGAVVVLAGWGPPERCATSSVMKVATKLADPLRSAGSWRPAARDDLEDVAQRAGLKPDGSGRVACPFGYADVESAVRGLLSTGLFDAAVGATDKAQVDKELTEALHPHRRRDGTVWMPNVFRYLIARTP